MESVQYLRKLQHYRTLTYSSSSVNGWIQFNKNVGLDLTLLLSGFPSNVCVHDCVMGGKCVSAWESVPLLQQDAIETTSFKIVTPLACKVLQGTIVSNYDR